MTRISAAQKPSLRRTLMFALVSLLFVGGGVATALSLPRPTPNRSDASLRYPSDIAVAFDELNRQVASLQDRQAKSGHHVASDQEVRTALTSIQLEAALRQYGSTRQEISSLRVKLAGWNSQLRGLGADGGEPGLTVPIVVYHYTPDNFAQQLDYLKTHGYETVDLDQVASAMTGGNPLPAKPVVITFDDGFANQLAAFDLLKRYQMKATYYIINGGEGSRWCIGAGRRTGDPLQPPGGCGDSYLNWDQVKMLDKSGLITIGAHSIDHENLAAESPERQRFEIAASKADLERRLGHEVRHFCYPYGSYDQTTIDIVRQAGFVTAATTLPGTIQPAGSLYELRRIRDTLSLP